MEFNNINKKNKMNISINLLIILNFINVILILIFMFNENINAIFIIILTNIFIFGSIFNYINSKYKFNFMLMFNVLCYLYTVGIIFRNIFFSENTEPIQIFFTMLSVLAFISFNGGYSIKANFSEKSKDYFVDKKLMKLIVLFIFIFSLGIRIFVFYKIGFKRYIYIDRQSRFLILNNISYFIMFFELIYLVNTISLDLYFRYKDVFYLLIFLISFFLSLVMSIFEVDRSNFFKIIVPTLFICFYYKKLSFKNIFALGLVVFFLFLNWKFFLNSIIFKNEWLISIKLEIPSELYAWHRVAADVYNSLEVNEIKYLFGKTYYKAFQSAIMPIFQNYESLSTWYVRTYHTDMYFRGAGFAFSPIIEAYLNFNIIGVFLVFFLFGLTIKKLESKINYFNYRVFYALLLSSSYKFLRSEFYSIFKNSFWSWGVPLILISIFVIRKESKNILKE